MIEKAIHKLYNSNDLFELADGIETLLSVMDGIRNKNKVLREIFSDLYFYCMGAISAFFYSRRQGYLHLLFANLLEISRNLHR